MRIISGKHKGKSIVAPKGIKARPTTDFAKESLFNILSNKIDLNDIEVLDLFCGTGNISFEFASRGAASVTSVDQSLATYQFVNTFGKSLNLPVKCIKNDVFKYLKTSTNQFDVIFCDPPYEMPGVDLLVPIIMERKLLKPSGMLIIEHSKEIDLTNLEGFVEQRAYGKVNFSFFSNP
jgi:16S rRNA (guanine(966)-N(2))-methyltransferase RsmD